jgi:hypothetical protein
VYAEYRVSEPREGGLFIQWDHPSDGLPVRPYRYHPTPQLHGSVQIINAREVILALEAEDGTRFQFDICAEAYVE